MKIKLGICLAISILLVACSAKYREAKDGSVAGYRDFKVAPNAYVVEYTEHHSVPWEQIHRLAIQRSAELAELLGYAYFDVNKKTEQTVYFKNSVDRFRVPVSSPINPADPKSPPPAPTQYDYIDGGANTEGRRVIYEVVFSNE